MRPSGPLVPGSRLAATVALVVVFVVVPRGGALVCGNGCVCDWYPNSCLPPNIMLAARALTGRITSTWFAAVPSVASYTSLYLSVNLIISIDPAALGALTSLRYIDLSTNQVAGLEAGTFQANTRLTTLNLAVNRIASLPAGVFSSLSQLQALMIGANALTSIPANAFAGLTSLLSLNMAANAIGAMDAGALLPLTSMQSLYLNANPLTTMPLLSRMSQLQLLDVTDNKLQRISAATFLYNTRLTWLSVSASTITTIDAGAFSMLSALAYLQMNTLQVTSIPATLFSALTCLTYLTMYSLPSVTTLDRYLFQPLTSYSSNLDLFTGMVRLRCVPLPPPGNTTGQYLTGGKPICAAVSTVGTTAPSAATPSPAPSPTPAPSPLPALGVTVLPSPAPTSIPKPAPSPLLTRTAVRPPLTSSGRPAPVFGPASLPGRSPPTTPATPNPTTRTVVPSRTSTRPLVLAGALPNRAITALSPSGTRAPLTTVPRTAATLGPATLPGADARGTAMGATDSAPAPAPTSQTTSALAAIGIGAAFAIVTILMFMIGFAIRGHSIWSRSRPPDHAALVGNAGPAMMMRPAMPRPPVPPSYETSVVNPWATDPVPSRDVDVASSDTGFMGDRTGTSSGNADSFMTVPIERREPVLQAASRRPA